MSTIRWRSPNGSIGGAERETIWKSLSQGNLTRTNNGWIKVGNHCQRIVCQFQIVWIVSGNSSTTVMLR